MISDLNGDYGSTRYDAAVDGAVARIIELKPDLVISTGDMVAGQRRPHLTRSEIEQMWSAYHAHVSTPLAAAGIPLAVTPGNHDASAYAGFSAERDIFAEQWTPRGADINFVDKAHYPFYYAFEVAHVLFISLDATTVGHLPSAQMAWLRQLLARYATEYQHRVVFSHLPLWPFAHGREREFIGDPELESLLRTAAVELYLSGHHHAFYPGTRGGVAFVGQSCLGAGPRRLLGEQKRSERSFTWLDLSAEAIRVAAFAAPRFDTEIDWATLPTRVGDGTMALLRADLVRAGVKRLASSPAH